MLVSYKWLQDFFEQEIPSPEEVAELLTFGAFEIEGIEKKNDDTVIDVDVLPNRASDCLSHRGIAHEVSVHTGVLLADDPLGGPIPELENRADTLRVEIEDNQLCPVYAAALIRGVKVGPSPDWIKERLEVLGHKSINNVVDATNYTLLSIGQPTHVFDAHKLTQKDSSIGVGVRFAKKGEGITTLGGAEYTLTDTMSVIVDMHSDLPIAIAGVKGGTTAEVDEQTTDIVIESAKFNPAITRRTAQELALRTDASKRFENEVPNELPLYGIKFVVDLILEIAGGELVGYAGDVSQGKRPYTLGVSVNEVNKTLGTSLSDSEISDAFDKLGFQYERIENPIGRILELASTLVDKPYKYGASVSKDAPTCFDCSSFISYLLAKSGIFAPRVSADQYVWAQKIEEREMHPGDLIFSNSRNGTIWYKTHEFIPGVEIKEGVDHVGLYLGEEKVIHATRDPGEVVIEKLSESKSFKNIVGYRRIVEKDEERFVVNVPFNRLDLRKPVDLIEEIGRVYGYKNIEGVPLPEFENKEKGSEEYEKAEYVRSTLTVAGYTEIYTYSLTGNGEVKLANALASDKDHLRSNLSDAMKEKLEFNERNVPLLGLYKGVRLFEIGHVFTKKGEEVRVCIGGSGGGKKVQADIGAALQTLGVHPAKIADEVAEFNLSDVTVTGERQKHMNIKKETSYRPISPYPFVLRDIAVWVPESTRSHEIIEVVKTHTKDLLVRDDMFDEYKKDGRVSYAFHLVFQSDQKTLTDREVGDVMKHIEDDMKKRGWEVR